MRTNAPHPSAKDSIAPNALALIDARRLALRCRQLDQERLSVAKRCAQLEAQLQQIDQTQDRTATLAAFGEQELNRLADETRIRFRLLDESAGERNRLAAFEALTQSPNANPDEISRWHRRAREELRALLPAHPVSRLNAADSSAGSRPYDWRAFQTRPAQTSNL